MHDTVLSARASSLRIWMAVLALGVSAFAIVTSELAPVGMLNALASDLHQTESGAGMAVTAYGWVAAIAALCSAAMPARFSRKGLLVGLMIILALSALAATQAASMGTFMSARMVGALAHGAFWSLIGSVAVQLVPAEKLGLATAVIFGGVSAASVLGVPLSSFIAGLAGWRSAFKVIATLSLATACALLWSLPRLSATVPLKLSEYGRIFRTPVLLALYAATALIISAHFAVFTFIEPLLTQALGVPRTSLAALLLISGVAGLVGNCIAGKFIDRHLKTLIIASLTLITATLALLGIAPGGMGSILPIGMLVALWGAGMAVVFVGFQTWLLRIARQAAQPASAIYVAIFNAAIGTGALAGGVLANEFGLQGMTLVSAAGMACGVMLVAVQRKP